MSCSRVVCTLFGVSLCAFPALASEPAVALFVEQAAELGLDFVHFNGMSGELYYNEMMGAGAALFDYDGDGDLDAYLVQGQMLGEGKRLEEATFPPPPGMIPLTDRLYRNDLVARPDGRIEPRFVDVTAESGIAAPGYGMGAATGDVDNDGDVDLYVTNFGANQLWRNEGDGTFTDVTASSGTDDRRWSVAAVFFDYDRDGWLDLYVGNYVDFTLATHNPCLSPSGLPLYCGPLSYPPETDRLFHNRGDGTFQDVALTSGIGRVPGAGLGAIAGDFDQDGWPDLYVANDTAPNFLWINREDGTFRDEALLGGCAVNAEGAPEASMGVDAGDVDGDGDEDLLLTHLTQETHTLYSNEGGGLFRDVTLGSGLGAASWAATGFGTGLLDYDNDGWLDLLVVNGAVKQIEEQLQRRDPYPLHQPNQLFHNLGGGRLEETSEEGGPAFALSEVSRGAAFGDLDLDGDTDVLVSNNAGPARLLINQRGQEAGWIGLSLLAGAGISPALAAQAELEVAGSHRRLRTVRASSSWASANDPRLLFGLGSAQRGERLTVRWPDGGRLRLLELPGRRFFVLRSGDRSGPES